MLSESFSRNVSVLAVAAWLLSTPMPARVAPAPVGVTAIAGSWRLEQAAPDPDLFRAIPGPRTDVDASNDSPLRMYLAVETDEAQQKEAYLNAVAPHLLSRDNFLAVGMTPRTLTVSGSLEAVVFQTDRQPLKTEIAGVPVKVTTERRETEIIQEITGDHSLKIERTWRPSGDGSELQIALTVLSPKVTPPLTATRAYRRLAAEPFAGRIPTLPDGSLRATQQADGSTLVSEDANLTLRAGGPRSEVLLVGRPIAPVNLAFQSFATSTADPVDFTMPGPIVDELGPNGARQTVGTKMDVYLPASLPPTGQVLRGPARTLVVTWASGPSAAAAARACCQSCSKRRRSTRPARSSSTSCTARCPMARPTA